MAYLRCKACGFIIEEEKLGEVCPACGSPKQVFEEHKLDISEKRKKKLDLHLHPMLVHFPEALAILIFLFSGILLIFPDFLPNFFKCSIPVLAIFLPLFTVFAVLAGLYDGKLRYKRLDTPYLKKKIIFGIIFLSLAVFLGIMSFFLTILSGIILIIFILSIALVICGGFLGLIGGQLVCPAIKG